MPRDPDSVQLVHITPISNLTGILRAGGLFSDAGLADQAHEEIGYSHIKFTRLTEYRVSCCDNRFVGTFAPFYYCSRSPMLSQQGIVESVIASNSSKVIAGVRIDLVP